MPALTLPGSDYSDLYAQYNNPGNAGQYVNPALSGITRSSLAPTPAAATSTPTGPTGPAAAATTSITGPNQATNQTAATGASTASDINTVDITSKLPDYLQNIAGSISALLKPPALDIGLTGTETQSLLNQNRLNIQGQNNQAIEQAREQLGRAGLQPGESGIADSALGQIIRSGQSNLAASQTDIVNQAIANRFAQEQAAQTTYQNQLGTMASLMNALYPSAQFAQTFPYQQQQDALAQLQGLSSSTANQSNTDWSALLSALTGAIG